MDCPPIPMAKIQYFDVSEIEAAKNGWAKIE
jgi:hypothetical protein